LQVVFQLKKLLVLVAVVSQQDFECYYAYYLGGDMTVCIAAICAWEIGASTIIAMSDRMITSADVQFEPEQNKMYQFNSRIGALIAGNAAPQMAVCSAVSRRVGDWNNLNTTVEEVANLLLKRLRNIEGAMPSKFTCALWE
jgi:hypothetical protein